MDPRFVYFSNELVSATSKDVLSALQKSNVIYQSSCHCDCRYVGCASQRLQGKIKQPFPNLSVLTVLLRNAYFLPVDANLLIPSLLLLIQPLDFIFYKILPVFNIMMTVDSLFSPKAALFPSICS